MVPRSFITNIKPGDTLRCGVPTLARGIAFGGDAGVSRVEFSGDGGKNWEETQLGMDEGKYSFRQWQIRFNPSTAGNQILMVRCTSTTGEVQPDTPNWNPAGFMRNVIEQTPVVVA
jgi:Mo-co oxidoreductase dimerisation domain